MLLHPTRQRAGRHTLWPLRFALVPIAFLLLAGGTALWRGFDGLYGQDSFAYYSHALRLRESLAQLQAPPSFFWPVGYPALLALAITLTGPTPLAGQLVSLLAGAGAVALTGLLARELLLQAGYHETSARWVGAAAALIAAGCGQLWQWSITVMSDSAALCWATLAAWALARYSATLRLRWLLFAVGGLACALTTRWIYGLLVIPLGAYLLLSRLERRTLARHLPLAGLIGLLALAPQLVVGALHGSLLRPLVEQQWLELWSPLNALRSEFVTVDGYAAYPLPVALFYAKAAASPRFLFPLLTPFLLLGAPALARRRCWPALALLLGWGGAIYGFLSGMPAQNFRFTLALLPAEAIMTAVGLYATWKWLAQRGRIVLLLYLSAAILGGLLYSGRVVDEFIERKEADLHVTHWVQRQTEGDGHVIAFGLTLMLEHYTPLEIHELYFLSPEMLQSLLADGRPTYLLLPLESVERQWSMHPPGRAYRLLRDGPGLVELGRRSGYTLFAVGQGGP